MGRFATVDDDTIRRGACTDIYFVRTEEILRRSGRNPVIAMEVTAADLPMGWAVFCGLDDVLSLLEGIPLTVDAMDEGTIFFPGEPVIRIEGHYLDFARYETAVLGFLCHASGIATAAASIRHISGGKKIYSFGSRRQHPAIATMVERAAWIGGVDGVSNTAAPPEIPLVGTMPHSFVMCFSTPKEAFSAFDRYTEPDIPRIFLCDTFCDEKKESLAGARSGAQGVRLDTPRSRKGNMRAILEEVRWELDAAGYREVQIVLSGGVTRSDIIAYRDIVDAFGVGGAIANAPVVDFAMDIVSIDGVSCAKRGKKSGTKQVWELQDGRHLLLPSGHPGPEGGIPIISRYIRDGVVLKHPPVSEARNRLLRSLSQLYGMPG
ncbi:MAG: nicotinate phosphoribosyltransferase [Methanoregulaceae archaeon]|jgi:nicotinate phosphoribosyltransferase|nr:nicotinate phosphoribosyltransferase [Methanoregulaceae archaeon]MCU0628719.1 nicotinate phosphoribosyltransferase [Methanoregulaceae archaeon]